MDTGQLIRKSQHEWWIPPSENRRVPGIIYATEELIRNMDQKVYEQVANVASLPGIVNGSYAMPDAHWGYGFPIGGVAAFDPEQGGVVSAGGVGFDISCGVRTLLTGLDAETLRPLQTRLADLLYQTIPAGVGRTGDVKLSRQEMDRMLAGGARWAVDRGFGSRRDLERIEEGGCVAGAAPEHVSEQAKTRQQEAMGTLGSGNHYVEVQRVAEIFDDPIARVYGLGPGKVVISIHCGSRGLGHQIGTEFLRAMAVAAKQHGIHLPDRELACAPIHSSIGRAYLGAMRAAINCALANRQMVTQLVRRVFEALLPQAEVSLLYDVSHNTCKEEEHEVDGRVRHLFVHRKGATRAFGPGHPEVSPALRSAGQPVLIGGTMGTASYILAGTAAGMSLSFGSACHGAGRSMSRHEALKRWRGQEVVQSLAHKGILVRSRSKRGVAEEAPGAYKDVAAVVDAAEQASLARKVVRLEPMICIKG